MHFFTSDDCEETIIPDPNTSDNQPAPFVSIEEAYEIAEDLIETSNLRLEENRKQWQQMEWGIIPEKPAQCVPFRYALSGVYIHCSSAGQNTNGSSINYFQNNFGVNTSTEFNAYFVSHSFASGQANGVPGTAFISTALLNESNPRSIFNHEMGHVLGLSHSWRLDGLADTPEIVYQYDFNCNGNLNDVFNPGVGSEMEDRQCFFFAPDDPDRSIDYDGDGIVDYADYCNIADQNCQQFPCCIWQNINNDIMAYNSYNECCSAHTEDQITRVLEVLSMDDYCDYIEEITDDICSPPMANLHYLPTEEASVADDCAFCFQLGASMHDEYYLLEFVTANGTEVFNTGWRSGPANQYCISRSIKYATQYRHGFQPGVQYTAILTVENDCGDVAVESLNFTLPPLPPNGCQDVPFGALELKSLYPNPFISDLSVRYKTERTGSLSTWLIPANPGPEMLLEVSPVYHRGTFTKQLSAAGVASGVYYLVLDLDGVVVGSTLLKL